MQRSHALIALAVIGIAAATVLALSSREDQLPEVSDNNEQQFSVVARASL